MSVSEQRINFLLVDDEPDSIKNDLDEVMDFLENKGHIPNLIKLESVEPVLDTIKEKNIDIVLTDKNIENKGDGLQVVKNIRSKFKHLDILFYSADKFDREELDTICTFGSIEIIEGREILDRLQTLVEKNISRWENMNFLRGLVISRIIELELEINEFLEKYFSQESNPQFRNFVLENKFVSLEAKKKILAKIIDFENIDFSGLRKLNDLQEKRNILAHCRVKDGEKNKLVHMGDPAEFTRDDIYGIFNKVNDFSASLADLGNKVRKEFESD